MLLREFFETRLTGLKPVSPLLAISAGPLLLVIFVLLGPFLTSPLYEHSGLGIGVGSRALKGVPTIDPNIAFTSFALGLRAAQDVISGHLPLWNHFQGFGTPLLGEMQSAALFPPTLLLLLPSGQALEHIFLQWLGGLGTYLFLRRFGLSTAAAIVGAVFYEFNGIFATLRNAAFNPVAFLPWLMFGIEDLRRLITQGRGYRARFVTIGLTAVMGAMALYAGFPETAYLYGILVVVWGLFRMVGLGSRQAAALLLDLSVAVVLALVLSAPAIVAFAAFVPEASIGGHGDEFIGMVQLKVTSILYLFPYFYGNFVAASDEAVAGMSIGSGGYIAVAPVILAIGSLFAPGYRAVKVLLCAWIVVALGTSHGWPVIYPAFMSLPLMDLVVPGRYLNASWILCVIFLAAMMIDRLPQLDAAQRRRCMIGALAGIVLVATAAVLPAMELVPRAWQSVQEAVIASVVGGLAVVICIAVALRTSSARLRTAAMSAAFIEAVTLFIVPFFAYPRHGDIDWPTLAFLKENIGFQRVARTDSGGLGPNFGAAFGVPLIHFDDLPTPLRTISYISSRIDRYAGDIFIPEFPRLGEQELTERRRVFLERLPEYARAGVKYIMAAPNFRGEPAGGVIWRDELPVVLDGNSVLKIESRHITATTTVAALTVRTSNFRNTTTGTLTVRFCTSDTCSQGVADFASVDDGKLMFLPLEAPLTLEAGEAYTLEFHKNGPTEGVIWTYPRRDDAPVQRVLESPRDVPENYGLELTFIAQDRPKPAYVGRSMSLYELPDVRPYAAAPDCDVTLRSYDEMETSCRRASKLVRLTVHMKDWSAAVNGEEVPIGLEDDTFQVIDVPEGTARIVFRYWPSGLSAALFGAGTALALIIAAFAGAGLRRYRNRGRNSADEVAALA